MTTLLKNASYLRVAHAGQTTGSLFLADLADEENALQNRKIPVYVPEGGSITLPLDEDVLLSYQQGTIRGLEDQGYLTTSLLDKPALEATYWVAMDGDDTNPGTYSSPYASVAQAVKDIQADFGHDVVKTVKVKPGTYVETEPVFINSRNFTLEGEENSFSWDNTDRTLIEWDTDGKSEPILVQTNMTREAWDQFIADGGIGASYDGTTFTWNGAQVTGRATEFTENRWWQAVRNVTVSIDTADWDQIPAALLISTDNLSADRGSGLACEYENVAVSGGLYCKNITWAEIKNVSAGGTHPYVNLVMDNSAGFLVEPRTGFGDLDSIFCRLDFSNQATEGKPIFDYVFRGFGGEYSRMSGDTTYAGLETFGPDAAELFSYQGSMHIQGEIDFKNDLVIEYDYLTCGSLTKSGTGNMVISDILVKARNEQGGAETTGGVTISGGTSNVIEGGFIEGDLTVNSPATADLTGVVVKGDILGDGDLTMNGGGYLGTNSLSGTFTYNALGTT